MVGVLEMWEDTLEVLENVLPYFFAGARDMYKEKYEQVSFPCSLHHVSF